MKLKLEKNQRYFHGFINKVWPEQVEPGAGAAVVQLALDQLPQQGGLAHVHVAQHR